MSGVPKYIRDSFVSLAEEEFADNYAMCLAQIFKEAMEFRQLKSMLFRNELNIRLGFDEIKGKEEQKDYVKKMLDGTIKQTQEGNIKHE